MAKRSATETAAIFDVSKRLNIVHKEDHFIEILPDQAFFYTARGLAQYIYPKASYSSLIHRNYGLGGVGGVGGVVLHN